MWMRMRNVVLLGFVSMLAYAAEPGTTIPETPAGQVLRAWLAAFNSGDRAEVADYLGKYEPDKKDSADRLLDFRERTGGFALIRVEKSEPRHLEALVKEREGSNYGRLEMEVSDSPSPTVKLFGVHIVPRPADQPEQPRLSFDDAVKAMDAQAAALAAKDRFAGAIAVARGGKVVLEKAYGFADREKQEKNTVETKFRIGSMNKMFTATAVLQLVEAGKIDLSAPLGKYLTDYPNHELAAKVTIRNLLTHTGGTGDIFTPEYEKQRLRTRELTDYVKLFGSRGLAFEPGSKWDYSNYGFVLLGVVIEKVSGMSYYDYVRKNIFEKAGMGNSGSLPEADAVIGRSTGYMRQGDKWTANTNTLPWRASSAGGGYSTVGDLVKFAEALMSGKLISPALYAQMTSVQTPLGPGYGFGMMVSDGPPGKRFGHGGGAPGMNGELRVYPKTRTVVVVLANEDPPAATRVADVFDEKMPLD